MEGLNPCPYCKGEVEIIKLCPKPKEKGPVYRIECRKCRALVARGLGYPNESKSASIERIRQYEELTNKRLYGDNPPPIKKEITHDIQF